MRATTRVMRSHGLQAGKAIPHDKTVDVWRCPACSPWLRMTRVVARIAMPSFGHGGGVSSAMARP